MDKPWCYDRLFDRVRRDWDAHDKTCQSMRYFWLGHTGGVSCPSDLTDCDGCRVTFYNEGVDDINWDVPDADPDYRCECCRRTSGAGFVRAYECGTSEPTAERNSETMKQQVSGGGSGI